MPPAALQRLAVAAVTLALVVPAMLSSVFLTGGAEPAARPAKAVHRAETLPPPLVTRAAPAPAPAPLRVVSVLQRPETFDYGASIWRDEATGVGPVLITVDLRSQLLRVWRGGREVGVSTILYGAPDSPTPLGTFPITQKSRDHVSNIYETPMPFALRLTNDGVMVHASNVRSGWASNGCIGIPKDFARQLFAVVKLGDKVVITDGELLHGVGDTLPVA